MILPRSFCIETRGYFELTEDEVDVDELYVDDYESGRLD